MQSKIKPIKTGKELRTTYFLGCKDYTHNFKSRKVKMKNKMYREKPNCVVCRSSKSRFLKQKYNNKKQFFQITKKYKFYKKNMKNMQVTRFQKKLILILKNKIKINSKFVIFLAKRTFIHEIEDKYDI